MKRRGRARYLKLRIGCKKIRGGRDLQRKRTRDWRTEGAPSGVRVIFISKERGGRTKHRNVC
jgi:hypothetical protein